MSNNIYLIIIQVYEILRNPLTSIPSSIHIYACVILVGALEMSSTTPKIWSWLKNYVDTTVSDQYGLFYPTIFKINITWSFKKQFH